MARQRPVSRAQIAAVTASFAAVLVAALILWRVSHRASTKVVRLPVAETVPTAEPNGSVQDALIVLDGATSLRRGPGAYGSYYVSYELTEKHPAPNALQQISSRLEALGWKPLREDWLNRGLPSSHVRGWTDFRDATAMPVKEVHQWGAQCRDQSGNIVDYTLRYSYPLNGKADLTSLWVNGSWYPAAAVALMQTAIDNSN